MRRSRVLMIPLALNAVALALGAGSGARALESAEPEPPSYANLARFQTPDGVKLFLYATRGWSVLGEGEACIAAVKRTVAGGIRTIKAVSGCGGGFRSDMDAGHATLVGKFPTGVYIQRQSRVDGKWTTYEESWPPVQKRMNVDLRWVGGERSYEPGVGSACVPMVVFYACAPVPVPYPTVTVAYDALVNGRISLRVFRETVDITERPGRLTFRLPL